MAQFDAKQFNAEVFGKYVERIPSLKKTELVNSKALNRRDDLKAVFAEQTGSYYATVPVFAPIDGEALNYDGQTDITADTTNTYAQSMVVVGRAKAWVERDFASDLAGGTDFMDNVAQQVATYWDEVDQATMMSVLKGIFAMSGGANEVFVDGHTLDISGEESENAVGATTLNTAMQKACGDNKDKFSVVVLHSAVATNLENLNLIERLKYTDAEGICRELTLGTWNGRTVLVDDSMPAEEMDGYTAYTSYVLGEGAFDYADVGAAVPYAMDRDEQKNGGQTTLYTRSRKVIAPFGVNFTKTEMATLSPTNAELENGANWSLVTDGNGNAINHKNIAIARIISRG